jgi:hypothetical protein
MPAFGFVLILVGIFLLVNSFNGNLPNLVLGNLGINFSSSAPGSTSTSSVTNTPTVPNLPNLTQTKPNA